MKLVYIAGPFRADTAWQVECNIRKAEELSLMVWRLGAACICPHANTRFFDGAAPDEVWLDGYIEILKRCDAVLLVDGNEWRKSRGTRIEVDIAKASGILVFESIPYLRNWLIVQKEKEGKANG